MCCEILTIFFLLISACVLLLLKMISVCVLLLLKITVRKKLVSLSHLSLSIALGVLKSVLHFSNLTMISEYGWCFQGKFCFVSFVFMMCQDLSCILTGRLYNLRSSYSGLYVPRKGGTVEIFQSQSSVFFPFIHISLPTLASACLISTLWRWKCKLNE